MQQSSGDDMGEGSDRVPQMLDREGRGADPSAMRDRQRGIPVSCCDAAVCVP